MDNPTGKILLHLKKKADGKTSIIKQHYQLPLQIMRPHYYDKDGTAFIYLMNPGGGVLQNDRFLTKIVAEEGTDTVVTTPSTTKFYKMEDGHAEVLNIITVKDNAVMEYLPEHNVPFAQAKAYQDTIFHLSKGAVLFASDMVTEGRSSRGEHFQYDIYASKTKIYVDDELILLDNTVIEPEKIEFNKLGMIEGYQSNGSFFVYAEDMDSGIKGKINSLESNVKIAATNISENLLLVRFLGDSVIEMRAAILSVWDICRKNIIGKDSVKIRKY